MATTRLISMHHNKGKSIADSIADRTDYAIEYTPILQVGNKQMM